MISSRSLLCVYVAASLKSCLVRRLYLRRAHPSCACLDGVHLRGDVQGNNWVSVFLATHIHMQHPTACVAMDGCVYVCDAGK